MYPYFDFYNVETLLLKEAQEAGDRLPQLGNLSRLPGIQSKCGAAQVATTGSGRLELWHDALTLRFDNGGRALRGEVAVHERRARWGLCERILEATRCRGHPNGGPAVGVKFRESVTISTVCRRP